jgi:hypothetical protein
MYSHIISYRQDEARKHPINLPQYDATESYVLGIAVGIDVWRRGRI